MACERTAARRCHSGWTHSWDRHLWPALPPPPLHQVYLPQSHHPVLSYHRHCCLHGIECLRTDKSDIDNKDLNQLAAQCGSVPAHSILVVVWASLIQIIMINTSAVVAVDDREGGSIGPPFELLVQGVWTFYLGITYILPLTPGTGNIIASAFEVVPFSLICTKMVFKYYAFEKARQSFALGSNPHLISGYMKQQSLQETCHHGEPVVAEDAPPPLLVMGEEKRRDMFDRVWRLDTLKPQKDFCFSFALFKLLRC